MIVGSGDPSIFLKCENMKALGGERQLDLHVHLFGRAASCADTFPGAANVNHSWNPSQTAMTAKTTRPRIECTTSRAMLMQNAPFARPALKDP